MAKKASQEVIDVPAKKTPVKRKTQSKALAVIEPTELSREAGSKERSLKVADVLMPVMNEAQMRMLCGRTPAHVIRTRPGRGGKAFRYIPYGYAVDSLNKAFGFDWDFVILPVFNGNLFKQTDVEVKDRSGKVTYVNHNLTVYGELKVRIRNNKNVVIATIVKQGIGSQDWNEANEFGDSLKGASSDALKRAAHELGVGLDLYFDEQVELNAFNEKKQKEEADKKREAEQVASAILNDVPAKGAVLLMRSMSDYQYDGARLCEILGVTLPDIINAPTELIAELWNKITETYKAEQSG